MIFETLHRLAGERDEARTERDEARAQLAANERTEDARLAIAEDQITALQADVARLEGERDEARAQARRMRQLTERLLAHLVAQGEASAQDAPSRLPLTPQSDAEGSGVAQEGRTGGRRPPACRLAPPLRLGAGIADTGTVPVMRRRRGLGRAS